MSMRLEEAIKILSELHDQCCQADSIFCTDTTGARCEAVDMAISALEKQIPKKPEQSKTPRYGMGYEYYDWHCPTCGRFLAFESSKGGHHCICGQAIDWEEE